MVSAIQSADERHSNGDSRQCAGIARLLYNGGSQMRRRIVQLCCSLHARRARHTEGKQTVMGIACIFKWAEQNAGARAVPPRAGADVARVRHAVRRGLAFWVWPPSDAGRQRGDNPALAADACIGRVRAVLSLCVGFNNPYAHCVQRTSVVSSSHQRVCNVLGATLDLRTGACPLTTAPCGHLINHTPTHATSTLRMQQH